MRRVGLRSGQELLFRPDLWFYLLILPVTHLFALMRLRPNQVGLMSLICGVGFIAAVAGGLSGGFLIAGLVLLSARIVLDCADGQLARLTCRTSSLGALYDLVSDFLFLILIAASLAVLLIRQGMAWPVVILAVAGFLSAACSTTLHSLYDRLVSLPETDLSHETDRFTQSPENDRPHNAGYTAKITFFSRLFQFGWGTVSRLVVSMIRNRKLVVRKKRFMLLLSPVEYGVQMTVLLVMVGLQVGLEYYFWFQVATLPYALCLARIFGKRHQG